jgi:hypothetical protein
LAPKATIEDGLLLTIIETFRHGSIEVTRKRTLARGFGDESSKMLVHYYGNRLADDDELRWIDLPEHSDEPAAAWSATFDDPRARDALNAYRRAYMDLLQERRAPPIIEESTELLATLRGLGYVGQEARIGALVGDELVLPPPGEGMLGKDDKR